jgi:HEAT repeat protein
MRAVLLAALLGAAWPAAAQPHLTNAQVVNRAVSGSLSATVKAVAAETAATAWIGWATPSIPRKEGDEWCWSDGRMVQSNRLEPGDALYVFLRIENRQVARVRMYGDGCPVDAGQRQVTWLQDVRPAESAELLAQLAADPVRAVSKGAVAALAHHAGREALQPLLRLARSAPEAKARGEALFWLAQRAGNEAVGAITDAIANDPETAVKKQAVFALSQLPPDEGVPRLIEVARTHANPAVRKQAMFWLGQSKDARALSFFEAILR